MADKSLSAGWAVAATLWVLGTAAMAAAVIGPWELVAAGVTMQLLGMTATVRQFHVQQARMMQNAFEMGRDAERRNVTPIGR